MVKYRSRLEKHLMLLLLKLRQKVKIASAHQFSCETIKPLHPKTGSWSDANYCSNTMPKRGWDGGEVTWHLWRCDATFAAGWPSGCHGLVFVCAGGKRVLQTHLETLAWKWALTDAIKGESLTTTEGETGHRFPGKDRSTVSRIGGECKLSPLLLSWKEYSKL